MWLQRFTDYLLARRWQTIALVFVSTFVPIIGVIGILLAALVTFRKGILEGAIVAFAATLPYGISFFFSQHPETAIPLVMWAAVGVAVLSNVLTWVFASMLRRKASWSTVIQIAALLGVLVISVVHLAYPQVADWWGTQLKTYYEQAQSVTKAISSQTVDAKDAQLKSIAATKQYATGLMTAAILFNALMQLLIARWWEAVVYRPGMLRRELHDIRLSQLAGVLFIVSLVFSYLGNTVVLDIMPVLYMLFGVAGLSLIHYLVKLLNSSKGWFWLTVFYMALIFSMPNSILFLAILALLDIWFDARRRFKHS